MKLVPKRRKDSWGTLVNFQDDMSKLFDNWLNRSHLSKEQMLFPTTFTPSLDIREDIDNIYVEADLPGMEQKDIDINLRGNVLELSAKREEKKEENKKNYSYTERFRGDYYRALDLLTPVDASKIKANYKNGVLIVTLPKREKEKEKDIKINVE